MKKQSIITTVIFALLLGALSVFSWIKPPAEFSLSERRLLAEKPSFSLENIASGTFQKDFETYTVDQFPVRDAFRSLKAHIATYLFNKKDNNGLFKAEGHLSKLEYPVQPEMVDHAEARFDALYETYMKDTDVNIYLSLIPDKNYFLAESNGYLSIDYTAFIDDFKTRMDYMTYIDVLPLLSLDDYYRTDSHWKQEAICDVAEKIAQSMGSDVRAPYTINTIDKPFHGVYLGQSALSVKPDTMHYLTNDILSNAKVTYYDSGSPQEGEMYNMEKAVGKDPYELFLSGTSALIEIENPQADSQKELVIFRDSFGSSLSPLLVPGYRKITVVDIRYIHSNFLKNFITFNDQDVLFLYSTTLINNSMAMR